MSNKKFPLQWYFQAASDEQTKQNKTKMQIIYPMCSR